MEGGALPSHIALLLHQKYIDRVLSVTVSRGTEEIEGYGFIFFKDGGWVSTIVDDQLFYGINRQSFKTSLCFGACRDECKTWLSLLEKAYVKIHGDYKSIDGGYTAEGIEDLLGVIPSIICSADILSKDRFWDGEMRQVNRTLFMGCAIAHVDIDGQMDKHGIQSSHAYSVLRVEEHKGGHFVQLRDPWGRVE
ncbi:hypothetical protein BC939DRAFT_263915 [Gamsiella multidivaricata]|uniref:uncharacterized protein n=1 Tax=Gamsiella multidivaricata TaxID=101098 RepID=UPI00221E5CEE|nr:uncharacterized protein BC939DRAFT_263915 [Gamsiella multidivaricata]KAI7819408.1 hypothetical protein BC939DRAFT_263915 [Gamsiella multidivaricata]